MNEDQLLRIEDLSISFPADAARVRVLDEVSLPIYKSEILGLVGESGSGKTITALSVVQLLPPSAAMESGRIEFDGEDLLAKSQRQMAGIRGSQISMIFQSPRSSLNPLKRVISQVARAVRLHEPSSPRESRQRALALLGRVGFQDAARRAESYPHQLSTGMCQRVMIAMMIASRPALLIADEPTTALDVTIAAQIYDLLHEIQQETGMSILLITHDLGLVAENCQRVAVMHAGHIVETGSVEAIFADPRHPYTSRLLLYLPRADREIQLPSSRATTVEEQDYTISGCRYARKCGLAKEICFSRKPDLLEIEPRHAVRCHLVI